MVRCAFTSQHIGTCVNSKSAKPYLSKAKKDKSKNLPQQHRSICRIRWMPFLIQVHVEKEKGSAKMPSFLTRRQKPEMAKHKRDAKKDINRACQKLTRCRQQKVVIANNHPALLAFASRAKLFLAAWKHQNRSAMRLKLKWFSWAIGSIINKWQINLQIQQMPFKLKASALFKKMDGRYPKISCHPSIVTTTRKVNELAPIRIDQPAMELMGNHSGLDWQQHL